jgi:hypothetical protein
VPNFIKFFKAIGRVTSTSLQPGAGLSVVPVAEPEEAFGWVGAPSLFNATNVGGVQGGSTVQAIITIPDDGFYIVDANANIIEGIAGTGTFTRRIALEVVDATPTILWSHMLCFQFIIQTINANYFQAPVVVPSLRLHLLKGYAMRWKILDAMLSTGLVSCSITARQLYQDSI